MVTQGHDPYNGTGQEFLMRTTSVPEPSTLLLMMTGLAMLIFVNRKGIVDTYV